MPSRSNRLVDGVTIWLDPMADRTAMPPPGETAVSGNDALRQIAHAGLFDA